MKIDWDSITDQEFEELCYDILYSSGFTNLKWLGRGGNDRGRDILCERTEIILANIKKETQYLIQCKRFVSRPPSVTDLNSTIAWADAHKPQILLIMVSNTLTAATHDWVHKIESSKSYRILLYEEKNFELFLEEHVPIHRKYFEDKQSKPIFPKIDEITEKIVFCLLDRQKKNPKLISKQIGEPVSKINSTLKLLLKKNILDKVKRSYLLSVNLKSFIEVSKILLNSTLKFDFLVSEYATDLINDELITFIEKRFFLNFSIGLRKELITLLKISPTALSHVLFSDNRIYQNSFNHAKSLNLSKTDRETWKKNSVVALVSELVEKTLFDLRNLECKKSIQKNNVEGYSITIDLKMANIEQTILSLSSNSTIMLLPSTGKFDAGSLLSVTDADLFIRLGNILMNLELLESALKYYDLATDNIKQNEKLKVAWNNKGLCLMQLKKPEDALNCYDKALQIDPNLEETKRNRKKCLSELGL